MMIRCAFFEGRIATGREQEFDAFVHERLVPLWTRFPGAQRVEVLREVQAEDGSHRYPMVLQTVYPSQAAIEAALESAVRYQSRAATQELMTMFEGRIFHVVYRCAPGEPAAA